MPKVSAAITQKAIQVAIAQVGKPYRWGAEGPSSFDCSGLLWYAYKQAGAPVGGRWDTYAMLRSMESIPVNSVKPGDFVFPHSGHVAMVIDSNRIVEAPRTGIPVRITALNSRRWTMARRYGAPAGGAPGTTPPGAPSTPGELEKLGDVLTSESTWQRVGMFLGGAVLLILGAYIMYMAAQSTVLGTALKKGAKVLK